MENKKCIINNCRNPKMAGFIYCYIHKNRVMLYNNYNHKIDITLYLNNINKYFNGCKIRNCIL